MQLYGTVYRQQFVKETASPVFRGPAAPAVAGGPQTCKGPQGKGVLKFDYN